MLEVHGQACPLARVQGLGDSGEEAGRVIRARERRDAPETAGTVGRERIGVDQGFL